MAGFTDLIFGINPQGTQIAALRLDILAREVVDLPSIATEYPVEDDSPMSDAILPGAPKLSISGGVSATSATVLGGLTTDAGVPSGSARLIDAVAALRQVYKEHVPVTIVTGLGVYPNMAMSSCRITRGNTGQGGKWLDIDAEFVQIRKVALRTTDIPADPATKAKVGATKAAAGKVAATDATGTPAASKGASIAKALKGTLGL